MKHFFRLISLGLLTAVMAMGCAAPQIRLFVDAHDPLREFTLQGNTRDKILVISIQGNISDRSKKSWTGTRPSMVQETVSQLRKAENDPKIKAVVLKINSPGGTTTASDILYHEIMRYKEKTGVKIVSAIMDVGASGAYYISLPAHQIIAHPTSITGSVGVIFIRPKLTGLMEKIGVDVEVDTSGQNKDMGSPFRETTEAEKEMLQALTQSLGDRFVHLVSKHRLMDGDTLKDVASARIYLAEDAKKLGLIDRIGYLDTAVEAARELAQLPENPRLVVYRRTAYHDDNIYNTAVTRYDGAKSPFIDLGFAESTGFLKPGFYYLWWPGSAQE